MNEGQAVSLISVGVTWARFVLVAFEMGALLMSVMATVNMLGNLRAFHRLGAYAIVPLTEPAPFVSVLVPARDEATNIAACVRSLLAQDYRHFEVIVLDDGSTDDTAAIVYSLMADNRLTLLTGDALPAGWKGKCFACHQLSVAARGSILLFTDADTRHAPQMIRSVVGGVAAGADVVTTFPEQEVDSLTEALVVPLMLFIIWAFLPVGRVWSDPRPDFVAANGQLLAFARAAYDAIGGHAAVRDSVLEDQELGLRAKRMGLRLRLADGTGTTRTRMYRSAGEVWRGFSKNAFTLLHESVPLAVGFTAMLVALYVVPLVMLVAGALTGSDDWAWRWLPLALVALMLVQRGIVSRRARLPVWHAALHPFSVLAFALILGNSVRWQRRGYGVWKGRVYATTPAPPPVAPSGTVASPRSASTPNQ